MSASTQSAAGRTSAARLRSAGGWPGAISPSRSLPGRWLTATAPNWSAQPARAWSSTRPPASRCGGPCPSQPVTTWLEHAVAYADMKWPRLAPHSRASLADALATVTLALTRPASGGRRPARYAPRCTGTPSTRPGALPRQVRPWHGRSGGWRGPHCPSPSSATRGSPGPRSMRSCCGWMAAAPQRAPSPASGQCSTTLPDTPSSSACSRPIRSARCGGHHPKPPPR